MSPSLSSSLLLPYEFIIRKHKTHNNPKAILLCSSPTTTNDEDDDHNDDDDDNNIMHFFTASSLEREYLPTDRGIYVLLPRAQGNIHILSNKLEVVVGRYLFLSTSTDDTRTRAQEKENYQRVQFSSTIRVVNQIAG